ncbi:MAG: GH25 family lysozyme [Candidatus Nomurabacteria bacterium]
MISVFFFFSCNNEKKEEKKLAIKMDSREQIGIDIHDGHGVIDFDIVKQDPIYKVTFVLTRLTMGKNRNDIVSMFNFNGARKADMQVGAYHFFDLKEDGVIQATNYLNILSTIVKSDFPPIVDIEIFKKHIEKEYVTVNKKITKKGKKGHIIHMIKKSKEIKYVTHPTVSEVKSSIVELKRFLNVVEKKTGQKAMIYSSADFFDQYLNGFDNPRWVAAVSRPTSEVKGTLHQFSQTLHIKGIKGYVDGNRFIIQ